MRLLSLTLGQLYRMPTLRIQTASSHAEASIVDCLTIDPFENTSVWEMIGGGYPPLQFVLCHVPCPRESPEKGVGEERGREGGRGGMGGGVT